MNIKKNLLLGAFAAFSIASASAAVTYVTGATSFEATTDTGLLLLPNASRVTWDNATQGKETNEIITWGVSSATNQIIVHWAGTQAVIQAIAAPSTNPITFNFYPTNTAAGLVATASANEAHSPQVGVYDNYQVDSGFKGTLAGDGINYATIANDTKIAAEGYAYIGNTNWPQTNSADLNITSQVARQLAANGALSFALISGNSNDETSSVFAIGRNPDGGTRVVINTETGVGSRTAVVNYYFAATNSLYLWPIETVDGISTASYGNSGFSTDGALRGIFTNVLADGPGIDTSASQYPSAGLSAWAGYTGGHNYLLGYSSIHNATGSAGVVILNYNGVVPSSANIEEGAYDLWAFAHIGESPNFSDTTAHSVYTQLGTQIKTLSDSQLGAGNAKLTNLKVTRSKDGGTISQTY